MNTESVRKRSNTGLLLSRPYSLWHSGLVCLLIRLVISLFTAVIVFDMLLKGLNIECDYELMHRIILICTAVFSLAQLNDIALIAAIVVLGTRIYTYINANTEVLKNGIMTMANQCYAVISEALMLPSVDGFDTVLADTYLTVNSVTGIFAVVLSVIIAVITIRLCSRLLYALGIGLVFGFLSFFGIEIDGKNAAALITMFGILLVMGSSRFVSFRLGIAGVLRLFKRKKYGIRQNLMYTLQVGAIAAIFLFASFKLISGTYGVEKFKTYFTEDHCDNIRLTARDIAIMEYAEYKNYVMLGNVSLGQMGYISYVKPDKNRTMFTFITRPITEGKLYFTSFVGQDYHYRYNSWTESREDDSVMINALKAAGARSRDYELLITEFDVYPNYADKKEEVTNSDGSREVTAYEYTPVTINDKEYTDLVYNTYLGVDEKNKEVIDKIIAEQGWSAYTPDLAGKIGAYFKNNYTYSLEQESLPYGKDFVNYFLEETKSGSFMHYVSAITLIYRELGIPARYVSGYVVDAKQILVGERVSGGRLKTDTKQLNIHSWVETYSPQGGWQMLDIVDAPDIEELRKKYDDDDIEEYTPNTDLDNYFRTIDKEKYSRENIASVTKSLSLRVLLYALMLVIAALVLLLALYFIKNVIAYARADNAGKAFIIAERLKKRLGISCTGYKEAQDELAAVFGARKAGDIAELAQRCIFSQNTEKSDIARLRRLCSMTFKQHLRAFALKHKNKKVKHEIKERRK